MRVDLALGLTAGTVGAKPPLADLVQDRLGRDRKGRVARTDELHVKWSVGHDRP